jgi:cytochrome c553
MRTLFGLLLLAPLATMAQPFANGDAKLGQRLHDKSCISCHKRMYGGDGSEMYTRLDSRIKSAQDLLQRVAACNALVNAGWFPEEEEHVAAYLNQKYYKFK